MNPECRAGKHWNCDGKGWREDLAVEKTVMAGPPQPASYSGIDFPEMGEFELPRCPNCDAPASRLHSPGCPESQL